MGLTQSSPVVSVTLRDYLFGHLHTKASLVFERHIDAFVKKIMLAKFPLSEVEKQSIANFKTTEDEARKKLLDLPKLIRAAQLEKESAKAAMPSAAPQNRNMLKQKITTAERKLRDLKKFRENFEKTKQYRQESFDQPRYVKRCQSAVNESQKEFVTFDRHWDMLTHVEIMREYLPDIFAKATGCGPYQCELKDLFDKLRQASWARTLRISPKEYSKPREMQVLDFLETSGSVLKLCGFDEGAAEVRALLKQAQELMQKATLSVLPTPATISFPSCIFATQSLDDLELQILCVAFYEFTERLQGLVGRFSFEDGNIRIHGAEAGKSTWSTAWQNRANSKEVTDAFTSIELARKELFHHDEEKRSDVDVSLGLKTMGQVLQWLHPGPRPGGQDPPSNTWGPCPAYWKHHLRLDRVKSVATTVESAPAPTPSATVNQQVYLRMHLQLSVAGMHMPIEREPNFVGREPEIAELKKALAKDGARVLVYGVSGVGKDRLVAELWRGDYMKTLPDISMLVKLQGSTDTVLRKQLIEHFLIHQGGLLRGHEHDPKACLELIHRWMRQHRGWCVFVENATARCRAMFECLPLYAPLGRVVVTSTERLDRKPDIVGLAGALEANAVGTKSPSMLPARTHIIHLKGLELRQSKQIWRNMKIYSSFVTKDAVQRVREEELRKQCYASNGRVKHVPAPRGEKSKSANLRQNLMHKALQRLKPPAARETPRAAKARLKVKLMKELEDKELALDELNKFLNFTLRNLPLSVCLCGQILHHSGGNIRALIEEFKAFKLNKTDAKNRSGEQDDRHYFGLAKLIIIGVRRMCTFCDNADASTGKTGSKKAAIGLLMALSLLHESLTPRDLFRLSPDKLREAWLQHQSRLGGWASSIKGKPNSTAVSASIDDCPFAELFSESEVAVATFDRARAVLRNFGFLRHSNVPSDVGVMHQLVREAVRNHFIVGVPDSVTMVPTGWGCALMEAVESILLARYDYTIEERWRMYAVARVQALSPCVESWCTALWDMDIVQNEMQRSRCKLSYRLRSACMLRGILGKLLREIDCSPRPAIHHHTAVLKMQQQLCSRGDHPDIVTAMNNLGRTLHATNNLDQNRKALKMQRQVLEMCKRLYPNNDHPATATTLTNLGLALHAVGRSREAIKIHKEAMVTYCGLYSEVDHPHIAMAMSNVGKTLDTIEESPKAIKYQEPVVDMYKRLYPGDHPDVARTMNNLALTLHGLNKTREALKMQGEVMEMYKRMYKTDDHPNFAQVLNAMGHTNKSMGNIKEAHRLMTLGLEMRKRLYPDGDHVDIARSMNSLALSKHRLGKFREAVLMQRESLEMYERLYSHGDHEDIAMVLANVGQTMSAVGQYESALFMQKRVVAMNKRLYDFDHQDTVTAMNCMALTLYSLYKYDEAYEMQLEVLAMAKRLHPDGDHQNIAACLNNLAMTLEALNKSDEALKMRQEVLEIDKRLYKEDDHPNIATAIDNLASTQYSFGKKLEAVKLWKKALEMRRRLYPSGDHPHIALGLNKLARVMRSVGKYKDSLELQRQVLEMRKRLYPDGVHHEICEIMSEMGNTMHEAGKMREALELWKQLVPLCKRVYSSGDHVNVISPMSGLALCLSALGKHDEAVVIEREVLAMARRLHPSGEDELVAISLNALGCSLHNLDEYPEALEVREQSLALYKRLFPGDRKSVATAMHNLGESLFYLKRFEEALKLQEESLDMRKRLFPKGHPNIVYAVESLSKTAKSLISQGRMEQAYAILLKIKDLDPDIAKSLGNDV